MGTELLLIVPATCNRSLRALKYYTFEKKSFTFSLCHARFVLLVGLIVMKTMAS